MILLVTYILITVKTVSLSRKYTKFKIRKNNILGVFFNKFVVYKPPIRARGPSPLSTGGRRPSTGPFSKMATMLFARDFRVFAIKQFQCTDAELGFFSPWVAVKNGAFLKTKITSEKNYAPFF